MGMEFCQIRTNGYAMDSETLQLKGLKHYISATAPLLLFCPIKVALVCGPLIIEILHVRLLYGRQRQLP